MFYFTGARGGGGGEDGGGVSECKWWLCSYSLL